jgi:hypothetical protein
MSLLRLLPATLLTIVAFALPHGASAAAKEVERAENAVRVLDEIMATPDHGVPDSMFDKAEAIAVVPDVVKAGFVLGGRYGRGLLSIRRADGTWSNPTYMSVTGGSVGLPGGRAVDGRGARVPHAAQRRFAGARQVHPGGGRLGGGRARSGAPRPRPPTPRSRPRSTRIPAAAACSPAWPSTARCSPSTTTRTSRCSARA